MKLKMLRQHYQSRDGINWEPKIGFKSEDEIKEKLGYNPKDCNIYTCSICNILHLSSYPMESK